MPTTDTERIEGLLADALAAHDTGGADALDAFLRGLGGDRATVERGLARCRRLGLFGEKAPARDFPERLGEFRLVRRLGSGGMGVVYEAEQESLGRRVALKVVRPELLYFEGARERFRREIEAVARLSHPAVVPVLASGDQDGVPWYAMELLQGRTVSEVCAALARRDPATLTGEDLRAAIGAVGSDTDPLHGAWWQVCARVTHAVALGVRHAHLRGIVHRDIKPSNVMLTADGRTVLLDFGVALLGGGQAFTRSGAAPGSPAFMSPEQLRGDAVDERTDVYSLGATLWQMLTLVPPFRGDTDLQQICDGEVPQVTKHNREVPRELVIVLQKAMDRDRERRYVDVEQFAQDLVAVLQRRPIRARRLDWSLRAWRWCQRHRVLATAMASLLVTTLALPGVFAWRETTINAELHAAVTTAEKAAQQERASLAAVEKAAQQERASLSTTLDAIHSMLVRVANDKFRFVPAAGQVAEDSLVEAVAMYEKLLPEHPEHVRLHVDAGKAISRLGDFLLRRGAVARARELLDDGIARLRGDSLDIPPAWLETRSVLRTTLGQVNEHAGDRAAAERAYDAADRDLAALANEPEFERRVAHGRARLASRRAGLHDPWLEREAMEKACLLALQLARKEHEREVANADETRRLVEQLDMLATMYWKQKRFDEALPLLDEALLLARDIPTDAKFWPPPPLLVAKVLETQGNLYVERRDSHAPAALKECLALREQAASDYPHDMQIRCDLAAALHNLAVMNFYQSQDDLALQRLDRAITLQRSVLAVMPEYATARDYLRRHFVQRGAVLAQGTRAADLHACVRELCAMAQDVHAQRSAARLWCRLHKMVSASPQPGIEPAACIGQAMQALQRAEALGWGPGQSFSDPVYAPLRGRDDYEALVARITAKVGSGAR
jgi:serine/threonine protein kinase/tetratricopeptide (TPR) repeat protein